ncbi:MAG: tryptophan synthase subunit alpha [Chitinophagaceae bacterium]|nr:tryptophan synthase subunit alpha [Chitinophagaceae bacterium]
MTRLESLFNRKQKNILSIYFTAGFPYLTATRDIMRALQSGGADLLELGMPYSDPLADGPVIQHSNNVALANGMSIQVLFDQLESFRTEIEMPVVLMGYLNPVFQYGFEKFCRDASQLGIDGLILPDLPDDEFESHYGNIIRNYGLHFIFLVTPETPDDRIKKLDNLSSGFLYAVSSSSVTGSSLNASLDNYMERLKRLCLKNPVLVGFGIKDRSSFLTACRHAQGAVIGSAFIRALSEVNDIHAATRQFLSSVLQG